VGEFPYTRGIYPNMYRGRLWTMRQYAGFGTASDTNARFRSLLAAGQTGLSVAFDLPTQMGYDSDHPAAAGEVGKVGVAIDSLEDMRLLLDGIPLGEVSTSMTINATAPSLLVCYQLVAEEQGVPAGSIRGTVQNDILKEYVARGTYIYPPQPSMRIVTDLFSYCAKQLPDWNTISVSGYHMREAGATAAQEVGFTLANALAYVAAARQAGLDVNQFAPRISFFWNAHRNLLEEVAKFRAARRLWARLMRERVGATHPEAWKMRFHVQTAGSSLTAQDPELNIVRTTLEALAAVLGGTQSLHTNAHDEALGLPSEDAARTALRTQQIIAYESGVTAQPDPLGGAAYIEGMTDQIETQAMTLITHVDRLGGAVAAVEAGFMQSQIEEAAYAFAKAVEDGSAVVVGQNRFVVGETPVPTPLRPDPAQEQAQISRLAALRQRRDQRQVQARLGEVAQAASGGGNLLYPIKEAHRALATVGEVAETLRGVFGTYHPRA